MDNMSIAEYKMLDGNEKEDGFGGGAILWLILIFLFFIVFSGRGFGNKEVEASNMAQVERDVLSGNCSTQKEILESRYTTQLGFQTAQSQQAACCCETNRNIDSVKAEAYRNTCEITNAIHNDGETTRALINANTIQELRDNLQSAQLTLSNAAQTTAIVNSLRPFPTPSYLTCSPYTAMNGFGCGNGFNNGCGCGCN